MQQYKDLIKKILNEGKRTPTRAKLTSSGENIDALTIFGYQSRYDLSAGFPLLTLKRLHWPSIVHELIWFLKGEDNISYLKENGISIWDEWATPSGDLNHSYPSYWRNWINVVEYDHYEHGVNEKDQVKDLISQIKMVKEVPNSKYGRRMILSAWHPHWIEWASLPPCHVLSQYHVEDGKLSCQLYQRSADVFLGVPFNIASYSLFTHILSFYCGLRPGEFIHTIGNAHIYINHIEQCKEMLGKEVLPPPTVRLNDRILSYNDLSELTYEDIELVGYESHGKLYGEVAV